MAELFKIAEATGEKRANTVFFHGLGGDARGTWRAAWTGFGAVAAIASAGVSVPLAYAFQSGFDAMKLENITLDIGVVEKRGQQQIADLIAPRTVHPGDEIRRGASVRSSVTTGWVSPCLPASRSITRCA